MQRFYTLEGLLRRISPIEESGLPDAALMAWTCRPQDRAPWRAPRRALDLACGSGTHALYLARRQYHVDALSRDREALDRARGNSREQRLRVRFIHANPLRFKPDRPYDLVVDYGLFHLLGRRQRRRYLEHLEFWTSVGSELILLIPRPRWSLGGLHPLAPKALRQAFSAFEIRERVESQFLNEPRRKTSRQNGTRQLSPLKPSLLQRKARVLIAHRGADIYRLARRA